MGKKVPVVCYKDGERIIVGEAEIDGDKIFATITDHDTMDKVYGDTDYSHFSIGSDEVKTGQPDPLRKNIFDNPDTKGPV